MATRKPVAKKAATVKAKAAPAKRVYNRKTVKAAPEVEPEKEVPVATAEQAAPGTAEAPKDKTDEKGFGIFLSDALSQVFGMKQENGLARSSAIDLRKAPLLQRALLLGVLADEDFVVDGRGTKPLAESDDLDIRFWLINHTNRVLTIANEDVLEDGGVTTLEQVKFSVEFTYSEPTAATPNFVEINGKKYYRESD